ncbi:Vitamin K epoxide reductase complex subunit 1-like protein 1 [Saguinus oedipus]|uniref:Vitamin K epoxide reductase complex subunit 1-like protein 1 n=1 Tax=Saguinus oedipus TaxID=9490 RepID=A0ABQ9U5G7_SAGOE|nr:Vitamin K epoxide reductase complex subunit 1-like protein 1 [Saguinus oedipus]
MAAPVLLRVSVPPWERVACYAIYADHVEREKEWEPRVPGPLQPGALVSLQNQ